MLNIYPSDTLSRQLKKQGYRFKVGTDVDWFDETLAHIEKLYINRYVTETEYKNIRERFLDDVEKNHIKKIDPEQTQATKMAKASTGTLKDLSNYYGLYVKRHRRYF